MQNWSTRRTCQEELVRAPILAYPDLKEQFILDTYASIYGIGAVSGIGEKEREARHWPKKREDTVSPEESLLPVHFMKQYWHSLPGRELLVGTDHRALSYLLNFKDLQGQIARWQDGMYNFDIEHCLIRKNNQSDALSVQAALG